MGTTASITLELFRHEWLRTRRNADFLRNLVAWCLQFTLWLVISLTLPYALEDAGMMPPEEHLPLLVLLDQMIRLVSQKTPDVPLRQYALLPIRRWQVVAAYMAHMSLVPTNLIWLPTLWHRWWLLPIVLLSGYLYLVLWHTYRRMLMAIGSDTRISSSRVRRANGLLACEIKMRLRVPALRLKIRNGLLASLLLLAVSLQVRHPAYTDFAVLYTLLFPSLPLLTSRPGYERAYMGLLSTRMHSLAPLYRARYLAALVLLLPCTLLLALPVHMGMLTPWRMAGWVLGTALLIYPGLLCLAPRCRPDSPQAQILTGAALTLPVLLANAL